MKPSHPPAVVIASCLFVAAAAAACGKSSDAARSGPTPIGDSGAVVDLPKDTRLDKDGDRWTVEGTGLGTLALIQLQADQEMPSDYNQERMVAEANPPVLDHHGVLSKGEGGLVVFNYQIDNRRFIQSWLPAAAEGKATYCTASGEGDVEVAFAICRSLRSKDGRAARPGKAPAVAAGGAPVAAPMAGERPVTDMTMDPRIVEPCVTECDGRDDSGDPATSAYGICFDSCKQRLADEINARVSGK